MLLEQKTIDVYIKQVSRKKKQRGKNRCRMTIKQRKDKRENFVCLLFFVCFFGLAIFLFCLNIQIISFQFFFNPIEVVDQVGAMTFEQHEQTDSFRWTFRVETGILLQVHWMEAQGSSFVVLASADRNLKKRAEASGVDDSA